MRHFLMTLACLSTLAGVNRASATDPVQTFAQGGPVALLVFSNDSKILAAGRGGGDATIYLWSLEEGELIGKLSAHASAITGLAFTPDGKQLVSAAWDGQVILWDVERLTEIRRFEGHEVGITGLALSPDASS